MFSFSDLHFILQVLKSVLGELEFLCILLVALVLVLGNDNFERLVHKNKYLMRIVNSLLKYRGEIASEYLGWL